MTEKMEGLTYVEGVKVYARSDQTGERLMSKLGFKYWIEDGRPACEDTKGNRFDLFLTPGGAPFRVIKPVI